MKLQRKQPEASRDVAFTGMATGLVEVLQTSRESCYYCRRIFHGIIFHVSNTQLPWKRQKLPRKLRKCPWKIPPASIEVAEASVEAMEASTEASTSLYYKRCRSLDDIEMAIPDVRKSDRGVDDTAEQHNDNKIELQTNPHLVNEPNTPLVRNKPLLTYCKGQAGTGGADTKRGEENKR